MQIRPARQSDAAALVEFNQAMAFETEGKRLDNETLARGVAAVLTDPGKGFYIVAESAAGEIVGGLLITFEWSDWRNGWFWWIQSVYIRPEVRGQRLYRRMYEFIKELAVERGEVKGFRLYVETENKRAQAVYDAVGMRRSHYLMYEEEL
ncbi:MAG: GNAT family N-acetyltransferase [Pyrinomonadaceae bacterium]